MKVCHFIASTGLGRGEAYIDLVNVLCEKVDIVLLVPKGALYIQRVNQVIEIIEYNQKNARSNPFLHFELYKIFKRVKPDIVHTHFAKASLVFYRLNKLLQLPQVATKHNPRKGKIYNKLANVIAVSEVVKQSIKHNNVHIIYNGLIPDTIKEKLPMTNANKVFTICSVGRLDKIKGYDILIKACSQLAIDYQLNIVGDGKERDALETIIKNIGVSDKVKLLGFRTDIPEIMNQSDLVVVSSHSEGFSIAALEALFYGAILISTKVGIALEILPKTFLANHAQLGDKITDVINDYSHYKNEFSVVKDKFKPKFLLENVAMEYIQYYEEMLKK